MNFNKRFWINLLFAAASFFTGYLLSSEAASSESSDTKRTSSTTLPVEDQKVGADQSGQAKRIQISNRKEEPDYSENELDKEREILSELKLFLGPEKKKKNQEKFWDLFEKYADLNPHDALQFYIENMESIAEKHKGSFYLYNPLLLIVRSRKLSVEEAYDLFKENRPALISSGRILNSALGYCLATLARDDLNYVLSEMEFFIKEDPEKFNRSIEVDLAGSFWQGYTTETYRELFNFFEKVEGLNLHRVISNWIREDSEGAASWLKENKRFEKNPGLERSLLMSWFRESPQEAAEWCLSNHSSQVEVAFEKILNNWSWREPDKALEWLINQDPHKSRPFFEKYLVRTLGYNPKLVLDNLSLIENEKQRNDLAREAYDELLLVAPLQAKEVYNKIFK